MTFAIVPDTQVYGDKPYLTHKQSGATPEDDRHFFGARIPNVGIFSFGAMSSNQTKRVILPNEGILTPIQLLSIYAFNTNASNDEIRFRLYQGSVELAEMKITQNEMPYQFPQGAIIDPAWSIEVDPRYSVSQLLIYWQPVHVIKYVAVL